MILDQRTYNMATFLTLLEIYSNPNDLQFQIPRKDDKSAIMISRGPGHNFKLLLSSEYVFNSLNDAVNTIKTILDTVIKECSDGFVCSKINDRVLTEKDVQRILSELKEGRISVTYNRK